MRRKPNFRTLDDIIADVEHLHQAGYGQQGNWTLGQVCNHLAGAVDMTLGAGLRIVPRWLQRGFVFVFLRLSFLGKLGNLFRLRIPTSLPQKKPVDSDVGIQRLRQSFDHFREANANHLLEFHLWHCQHHLSFLIPHCDEGPSK